MRKDIKGFTLIELMIVVAILGVIAGIAYPSYLKQVQKSNRSDAKVALNDVAQRLQRCFTAHGNYNTDAGVCTVVDNIKTANGVLSTEGLYRVRIANTADLTASTYLLTATPVVGQRQANDNDCTRFTLNQLGVRAAFKGSNDNTANCW